MGMTRLSVREGDALGQRGVVSTNRCWASSSNLPQVLKAEQVVQFLHTHRPRLTKVALAHYFREGPPFQESPLSLPKGVVHDCDDRKDENP